MDMYHPTVPSRKYIDRCTDSRLSLTDDEIRAVNKRMSELGERDSRIRRSGRASILIMVLGGAGAGFAMMGLSSVLGRSATLWIVGIGLPAVLAPTWLLVFGRLYKRILRQSLVECGHPVCIGCGYVLEGVEGAVCPECGRDTPSEPHAER